MPYVDLNTIHNPATGNFPPATWGDAIRDDLEYIVDPPQCSLSGVSTTCGNNAFTWIDAQVENYDTDTMHTGTNDYMTVKTAGKFLLFAVVQFSATVAGGGSGTTGTRLAELWINDTDQYTLGQVAGASTTLDTVINGSYSLALAVNDTIKVRIRQTGGGNMEVQLKQLTVRWVGR